MKTVGNHIDMLTLTSVLLLMVLSLGVVYSASSTVAMDRWGESSRLLGLQLIRVGFAIVFLFFFIRVDYHWYQKYTKLFMLLAVALLAVTLGIGAVIKGASRWLTFGWIGIQPSEVAKFALVFHLATLIATKQDLVKDFKLGYRPMLIWVSAVVILVLAEPNFSTGAMIFAISLCMIYLGRARLKHLGLTIAVLVPLLLVVMVFANYRLSRVQGFLASFNNPELMNHQARQGILGFGSGGLFGVGPGESRQRDFYLPESYGDFVFSIIGEEYGLIGTLVIMLVFLTIMLRGFRIARHARDEYGRMLAAGITISITLYALVNAAVTLSILPTTGLPMPFVSYGGSSMVLSAVAVGVLLNISTQTDLHPRLAERKSTQPPPAPEPAVGRVY